MEPSRLTSYGPTTPKVGAQREINRSILARVSIGILRIRKFSVCVTSRFHPVVHTFSPYGLTRVQYCWESSPSGPLAQTSTTNVRLKVRALARLIITQEPETVYRGIIRHLVEWHGVHTTGGLKVEWWFLSEE